MSFLPFLFLRLVTTVISRKTVKSANNTYCDTCAQNSGRYEFGDIFVHIVVISRRKVKSAKNTICDTCAQNSLRYEFCYIFLHTFVRSKKTVKSAKNTFCEFVHRTRADVSFVTFSFIQL